MTAIYGVQNMLGNQYGRVYNKSTHETLRIEGASVEFQDDFLSKYENIYSATSTNGVWTEILQGAAPPTVVMLDSIGGGVISLNLTNAAQKQEAGLDWDDYKNFNIDKGIIFEVRAALHTLPTDQAEIYFGLVNNYVEGPYAEADAGSTIHSLFHFDGAGLCEIHTDDTVNETAAGGVTTGITVVADVYHVYRMDFSSASSVKFYIDGARVASTTTFNMSNGSNIVLQPLLMCHKEAGAGEGSLYVDYCKIWQLSR